jgi:hypothetical protein
MTKTEQKVIEIVKNDLRIEVQSSSRRLFSAVQKLIDKKFLTLKTINYGWENETYCTNNLGIHRKSGGHYCIIVAVKNPDFICYSNFSKK